LAVIAALYLLAREDVSRMTDPSGRYTEVEK
jgi:hypothetical protein